VIAIMLVRTAKVQQSTGRDSSAYNTHKMAKHKVRPQRKMSAIKIGKHAQHSLNHLAPVVRLGKMW